MAQHDYSLANQPGATFRSDLNNALQAILTANSGATAPATTAAYMYWADTTAGVLKQRNGADSAWITLFNLPDSTKQDFYVNNALAATLDADGLGLGVANPAYRCDVLGDINYTGNLRKAGAILPTPTVLSVVYNGGTAGGTANSLTVTASPTLLAKTSINSGILLVKVASTNTSGTVFVNVDSLGTDAVKKFIGQSKVDLAVGDLRAGMIAIFSRDGTDLILENPAPNSKGATIASASTLNLDAATGDYVQISGTTTVTAVTLSEGRRVVCKFDGVLTLTNGASLILPTGANITTAAGDVAEFIGEASGVVRCAFFNRASGAALAGSSSSWLSDPFTYRYYSDDFIGKTISYYNYGSTGAGASGGIALYNGAEVQTGTTTTGGAHVAASIAVPAAKYGGLQWAGNFAMQSPSDGTNTFTHRVGICNEEASAFEFDPASGIYFRYTHGTNSGNLQAVCRASNVETVINTSVAPNTSYSYLTTKPTSVRFEVNDAASSVEFFVDGVSVGTITTNIPSSAAISAGHGIKKAAGTTSRYAYLRSQQLRVKL